jgi:hypothetical protein
VSNPQPSPKTTEPPVVQATSVSKESSTKEGYWSSKRKEKEHEKAQKDIKEEPQEVAEFKLKPQSKYESTQILAS